jgi:hypothetical protein
MKTCNVMDRDDAINKYIGWMGRSIACYSPNA